MSKRRLLILSCSARKRLCAGKIPAWDLYDGVMFRVVKRLQRSGQFPDDVEIIILSAKHGLIMPSQPIEWYDQKMTLQTSAQQAELNSQKLRSVIARGTFEEVFLCLGRAYLNALLPFEKWLPSNIHIKIAEGGIGCKMRQLRQWLLRANSLL